MIDPSYKEFEMRKPNGRPVGTGHPVQQQIQDKYGLAKSQNQTLLNQRNRNLAASAAAPGISQTINATPDPNAPNIDTRTPDFSKFQPAGGVTGVVSTTPATGPGKGAAPLSRVIKNGPGAGGGSGNGGGGGAAPSSGFYSPELEGLKHSLIGKDWFARPDYANQMSGMMAGLQKPVDIPVGMSDAERQNIYNQGRLQIQGATKGMMGDLANEMGTTRGLLPGESGVADTALGKVAQQGVQQLGDLASGIATNEAQNRFNQRATLEGLNINRLAEAGKMGEVLGGFDQNAAGNALGALGAGSGMEQFAQQLRASQAASSAAGSRAAQGLAWDKEKFNRQLKYQQEQDALDFLSQYYGGLNNQQNSAWQPYWSGVSGTY